MGLFSRMKREPVDRNRATAEVVALLRAGHEAEGYALRERYGLTVGDLDAYLDAEAAQADLDAQLYENVVPRVPAAPNDGRTRLPVGADPAKDYDKVLGLVPVVDRFDWSETEGRWLVTPRKVTRYELADGLRPTDAPKWDGYLAARGQSLLQFDPYGRVMKGAALDSETLRTRRVIAEALSVHPHEVSVVLAWKDGRIEAVIIERVPGLTAEKRAKALQEAILRLPGGSSGWRVIDEPTKERAVLVYGEPERLPGLVYLRDLLPGNLRPDEWHLLPVGIGTDGEPVSLNLKSAVHSSISGPTGAGKSVFTYAVMGQAIMRGFEIIVIETAKWGLDYQPLRPWLAKWTTKDDGWQGVEDLARRIYDEVDRRRRVLEMYGENNTANLSQGVREKERIKPWLIVVDEYASLSDQEDVPKGLPKDDPLVVEALTINSNKAVAKTMLRKLAAEARYVQIHLMLGSQRFDTNTIDATMRSNITGGVQLSAPGKPPAVESIRMVMPGEMAQEAMDVLRLLDDGRSKGLGVTAFDGGVVTGMRVAWMEGEARGLAQYLEDHGVPHAEPLPRLASERVAEPAIRPVEVAPIITDDTSTQRADEWSLDDFETDVEVLDLSSLTTETRPGVPDVGDLFA